MNQRIVLHLDMNSYYATLEQQAYPNLRGKPIGVAGKPARNAGTSLAGEGVSLPATPGLAWQAGERTVVVGASIEAKKLGVKGAMSTWEAKKICPQIIIVPANYDRYIFVSQRIFSLLERFSPKVEVFSIDEAFVDLPIQASWDDAVAIAKQMKQLIKTQIGSWVTCSIGISYGRTLAKLASELQKPDGLTVIKPENFNEIAQKTAVEELCGIGYRIRPRLNQAGIFTIAELGQAPKLMLTEMFGDFTGTWLHNIGNGIDDNRIRSFHDLPHEKSIGHSYTLPRDIASIEDVKKVALLLCERVGVRLRRKNLIGRTVSVYLRFGDKTGWGQRATQKEYILDGLDIYHAVERLLNDLPYPKPVRLLAISITDLAKQVQVTRPLFWERQRYEQLIKSVDRINNRYGEFTVHRGALSQLKKRIFKLPDGRNKRLYIPHVSPFLKRI